MARTPLLGLLLATACGCGIGPDEVRRNIILPEQRALEVREPAQFPPAALPPNLPPRTVADPRPQTPEWQLSLDDAIRIALENARVVRVLAGTTATASGQTIYDAAITNTTIDLARAPFDPVFKWNNTWSRTNTPTAEFLTPTGTAVTGVNGTTGSFTPGSPAAFLQTAITSTPTDGYLSDVGLTKTNVLGGQWSLDWTQNPMRFAAPGPFPLNPQTPSSVTLSYTQPLLQGAGFAVNTAPIVIARLNTEQSYFQYKDSVQELVRGVVEAYWSLVEARVNVWARQKQVDFSKYQFERESARLKAGVAGDEATVAQARVTYYQFRATLIAAEADVLTREGALRNLLFLPPNDDRRIVPTSAPANQRLPHDWNGLVSLAEQRRPDIIELKIIAEADQVRLVQAENLALPQLNAVALYRWDGLSGEMPNEEHLSTHPGQFTDWTLGVNFSVPLGLRQGRAQVRQQRLLIARDRANVEQQLHLAIHDLASTLRDLDSAYEQYLAFKETRAAAEVNLMAQLNLAQGGGGPRNVIFLNYLQAINDWGNAISSEAQQLLNYNTALASLERRTGTILETHGLVFFEERFRAAGPLGVLCPDRLYPSAVVPGGTPRGNPGTDRHSEDFFDLRNPAEELPASRPLKPEEELPRPRPLKPREEMPEPRLPKPAP